MVKIVFLVFVMLILVGCCEKCLAALPLDNDYDDEDPSDDGVGVFGFGLGFFLGFAAGTSYKKKEQ